MLSADRPTTSRWTPLRANAPIRSGRSSKARTEADTSSAGHPHRSQSLSESDLGSAFDPTRTVARAGTRESTPGSLSCHLRGRRRPFLWRHRRRRVRPTPTTASSRFRSPLSPGSRPAVCPRRRGSRVGPANEGPGPEISQARVRRLLRGPSRDSFPGVRAFRDRGRRRRHARRMTKAGLRFQPDRVQRFP